MCVSSSVIVVVNVIIDLLIRFVLCDVTYLGCTTIMIMIKIHHQKMHWLLIMNEVRFSSKKRKENTYCQTDIISYYSLNVSGSTTRNDCLRVYHWRYEVLVQTAWVALRHFVLVSKCQLTIVTTIFPIRTLDVLILDTLLFSTQLNLNAS